VFSRKGWDPNTKELRGNKNLNKGADGKKSKDRKKPFYKRSWFIVIIALVVIGGIASALEDEEEPESTETSAPADLDKEPDEDKKKEQVKGDGEKKKNKSIDQNLKEDNDDVIDADLYDEGMLIVKLDGDASFSENSLVTNRAYEILEIMKEAFADKEVQTVDAVVKVTLTDNKGNESKGDALNIVYSRESFEELNYDNFRELAKVEGWRVYNESDEYLIHPGIYNNLKDKIKENITNGSSKFQ